MKKINAHKIKDEHDDEVRHIETQAYKAVSEKQKKKGSPNMKESINILFRELFVEDGGTVSAVPVNNVGSGNVEGTGQGPKGEPGVDMSSQKKKMKVVKGIVKRSMPNNRQAERRATPYWMRED